MLKSIGYESQQPSTSVKIATAGGIIKAPVVKVSWFGCLGQQIQEFPIVAYNLPAVTYVEGLLGMDFFNRYPLMIYPQKAEVLYV